MNNSKKILIVDDDVDIINQTSSLLKEAGYDVISAQSEGEAMEFLDEFQPHIAILDVMMENKDSGFILCHAIKRLYPHTPVIIMTSVTSITGMEFGMETDEGRSWIKADSFINKPVRYEHLIREVKRLEK